MTGSWQDGSPTVLRMILARQLQALREKAGMSYEQAAEAIYSSEWTIRRMERADVETGRFTGTSYRAANWTFAGQTKGRGKPDRRHEHALPVKDIHLYPLHRNWRQILNTPLSQ